MNICPGERYWFCQHSTNSLHDVHNEEQMNEEQLKSKALQETTFCALLVDASFKVPFVMIWMDPSYIAAALNRKKNLSPEPQ